MACQRFRGSALILFLFVLEVCATGRISDFWILDGSVLIGIETAVDATYQVQCSTNLADNVWIDLEGEFTADHTTTYRLFSQNEATCYFRVLKTAETGTTTEPPAPPPDPPPPPA